LRGKGEWTNDEVTSEFSESYFTLVKHKRHRKAVSVQKSTDYKTLILMLLGEITFVFRPNIIANNVSILLARLSAAGKEVVLYLVARNTL
jgi:hypothetical protein